MNILETLWNDYTEFNPFAKKIHQAFIDKGEKSIINDHIAFRTFEHAKVGINEFSKAFLSLGYIAKDDYTFIEKKLYAKHFEHPDENLPKIFISEIQTSKLSSFAQEKAQFFIDSIKSEDVSADNFVCSGRHWDIDFETYSQLKEESEYLAWLSVFGFRANHFTVLVNRLTHFENLQDVNEFVKSLGMKLNTSGGEIKGSVEVCLEQSSTLSFNKEIKFTDGVHTIPTTYYEFAKRYEKANGELYKGFVTTSADKIFESTNLGQ